MNYISSALSVLCQSKDVPRPQTIENANALLFLGDKVTTDHISPAGSIARASSAAKYLTSKRSVPSSDDQVVAGTLEY